MDQNGIAQFACIENLAARARVSVEETREAVKAFESPDPFAPTQEYEGRRIERIDGGWLILNAEKYRKIVTRAVANAEARDRMRRHRQKNAVTQQFASVTPSDHINIKSSESESVKNASLEKPRESAADRRQSAEALARIRQRTRS
jgi:hypothetical protein